MFASKYRLDSNFNKGANVNFKQVAFGLGIAYITNLLLHKANLDPIFVN